MNRLPTCCNMVWSLLVVGVLCWLSGCGGEGGLTIEFYFSDDRVFEREGDKLLLEVMDGDIECVDWAHLSFRLEDGVSRRIDSLAFLSGSSYFSFLVNGEAAFMVPLYPYMFACDYHGEYPKLYAGMYGQEGVMIENWLVLDSSNPNFERWKDEDYAEVIKNGAYVSYLAEHPERLVEDWWCGLPRKSNGNLGTEPDPGIEEKLSRRFGVKRLF